ncbi:hypothetical protein ROHU_031025 [Labeo rohita]|uniref:Uncharacterized protein n=1 Tax=Labeo rohita TaxID=84645 RepID=A0A498LQB1_LABRO|nr:hypothetical protein ROHU_031025 [Labeo rohita]
MSTYMATLCDMGFHLSKRVSLGGAGLIATSRLRGSSHLAVESKRIPFQIFALRQVAGECAEESGQSKVESSAASDKSLLSSSASFSRVSCI